MIKIIDHKITNINGKQVINLYIKTINEEFGNDFFSSNNKNNKDLYEQAKEYINENIPNIKKTTINIVAGSIILLTFAMNLNTNNMTQASSNKLSYTVNSGDTLFKISKKFNTTVDKLKEVNNLNSFIIYPGQKLNLPKYSNKYIVQKNDTLYNISNKFNINIDKLKIINNLKSNNIHSNQTLIIPNTLLINNKESDLVLVNKKHFLPSSYKPKDLVIPNIKFSFKGYQEKKLMRKDASDALEKLFKDAKKDGINLYGLSGFRSYERQKNIFTNKLNKMDYKKANEYSAFPGESEHQTGLAIDITSKSVNYKLSSNFGNTKEGKWLKNNAYKYGFIIRYPNGKEETTGYKYEPWHIRYVGSKVAQNINQNNLTLEEYLGVL